MADAVHVSGKGRIRGPNLAALVRMPAGAPMEEVILKADEAGAVIASNKRLSQALIDSVSWHRISEAFGCWTGTMTAYIGPGERFGRSVECVDPGSGLRWIFPVPEEHRDKKDAILVAEHPDYFLEKKGDTRIIRAAHVGLIERFPAKEGWYLGDGQHDIPTGEPIGFNDKARHLSRTDIRVGAIMRGCFRYDSGDNRREIYLGNPPSESFGAAIEAI